MKGLIEEYGTFIATVIVILAALTYVFSSSVSQEGLFHKFVVTSMESTGSRSQVVLEEWDLGGIKATLKDDGCLYITGSGMLTGYATLEDAPWAESADKIDSIDIQSTITVMGNIPY